MLISVCWEVIIVNVYFFFGYCLLYVMCNVVWCGVWVKLIVQGELDIFIVKFGVYLFYYYFVKGGVQIYEYCCCLLYGKVVLVDDYWVIVGLSNLDLFSLLLNLEVNLIIYDWVFNQMLCDNFNGFIVWDCQWIDKMMLLKCNWWWLGVSVMVFYFLCYFLVWVGWLLVYILWLVRVSLLVQLEIEIQDCVEFLVRDNLL